MPAKYAYEYGRRWNVKTPRGDIKWCVGKEHVGTPDDDVAAAILARIPADAPGYTPAIRRECDAYARLVHQENRNLYRRVMRG